MKGKRLGLMSLVLVATVGCFHQVVQTGRPAGPTVIDKPMVATWLWGLVPAQELDMRKECPGGLAVVETEQSFMNGLLSAITLGIYTPQHVRVTCASGTASLPANAVNVVIAGDANAEQRAEAFRNAVRESIERDVTVVVRF
jgi:hypothetical protein